MERRCELEARIPLEFELRTTAEEDLEFFLEGIIKEEINFIYSILNWPIIQKCFRNLSCSKGRHPLSPTIYPKISKLFIIYDSY